MHRLAQAVHILLVVHQDGETLLLQKKTSVRYLRFEADTIVPLAFVLNKFKIGIAFLGNGKTGLDQEYTGYQ